MPQLNIKALIDRLTALTMELHEIYVAEKDFGLAERLLAQVFKLENLLGSLKTLV